MKCFALAFALLLGMAVSLHAQLAEKEEIKDLTDEFFEKEIGEVALPEGLSIKDLDEPTRERYFAALRECYQYRISGYQHRQKVFKWQLHSSKIIFFVVVFLVLVGIYFSGVQFHSSLKWKRPSESAEKDETTEIEASIKGIKVSSPILGVIILVISLLFFYLYLAHVYPITEIF